jgi:hypothetical protein
MPYGIIKVDTVTFTDNNVDKDISLSGLIKNPTFTGNVTATGTISGDIIRGGTTISGVTVTGTTANFVSGVFTTQVSGTTVTGTTANFVSGAFASLVLQAGTATSPSIQIGAGTVYIPGIYSPGTDQLAISTSGTGRLFVDASGNVGLGIATPSQKLHVYGGASSNTLPSNSQAIFENNASSSIAISVPTANIAGLYFPRSTNSSYAGIEKNGTDLTFRNNGSTKVLIDSSGRLIIGTSTSLNANRDLQVIGLGAEFLYGGSDAIGPTINLSKARTSIASPSVISNSDVLGNIDFSGYDGLSYKVGASVDAIIDNTPGNNDLPTALVFSTTADGTSSPTERMRISSAGLVTVIGNIQLNAQGDLRFADSDSSHYVAFQAPTTVATNVLWTLPATDGTSAQVLSTNGSGTLSWATAGSGDVTLTGTQTLTNKTLTDPAIIGTILEDVFTITDGAAFEVDPGNGSIQLITLGASRTPKCTNFVAGESITLMVNDGTAYTITWTDATWGTGGVIWRGGTAPTLATTGYSVIQFWKVSSQVYGASVGDVA